MLECFACDPETASESFNAWRWASGLAQAGHDIVLNTTEVGSRNITSAISRAGLKNIEVRVLPRNSKLLRLKYGLYLDYLQWLNRSAAFSRELKGIDLCHHVSWGNVGFGTRLWKLGPPTILGPCGGGQIMHPALFGHLEADRKFERVRSALVNTAKFTATTSASGLRRCHVLASNDASYQYATRCRAASVELFPDPMLDETLLMHEYLPRPDRKRLQIIWVGRMLPRKGVELAIKAFAKSEVDADLIMVGDGERMPRAKALANELGVGDKIKFLGSISRPEVLMHLQQADIFLFASLRDSMPVQLLESMSVGLPIICLDVYGNQVLLPSGAGTRVPVETSYQVLDGLATAIYALSNNRQLREKQGRAAFVESRKHVWEKKIIRMESVYSRILNDRSHDRALK